MKLVLTLIFTLGSFIAPLHSQALTFSSQNYSVVITSFDQKEVWVKFENQKVKFSRNYLEFKPLTGIEQVVILPKILCEKKLNKRICKNSEV